MEFPSDTGHTLWFLDADSLQNVYVIICNILEFVCYDRLCLCVHHVMEQIHQQFVQHPVVAFSHSFLYDIWNFSVVCRDPSKLPSRTHIRGLPALRIIFSIPSTRSSRKPQS